MHRAWVYKLKARYEAEGEAAFEPRSRRLKTSPRATPVETVELVLALRKQLDEAGLDASADTVGWHLQHHHQVSLSRATIHRILTRAGTVTPDPGTRPRSSYLRFAGAAERAGSPTSPHYRLTRPYGSPGTDVELITWLDDHSRYAPSVTTHRRITGQIVLATFVGPEGKDRQCVVHWCRWCRRRRPRSGGRGS